MIDDQLNWKIHTHLLSRKISKSVGILNKLKNILPLNIRLMIYNALISSYFNYGILLWGYHCNRLSKLQKMSIRHLTKSKYNAHTFPLFKRMNILTISDLFNLSQLKFYYKFVKNDLPKYFNHSFFVTNGSLSWQIY